MAEPRKVFFKGERRWVVWQRDRGGDGGRYPAIILSGPDADGRYLVRWEDPNDPVPFPTDEE